ncbi:ABC transporter transmembrane domain-containing protein [Methylobacterium sp. J-076]|uniref:ABC transporter transmembrane domain-containing protein n=1 Tax=Methylobacterium sp. J-076 TaxID=2836655 RepID=UPI0028C41FEF|nr:ABC transporter transmembrane domain-containing protein [Methylobacterium sp. J-076]
MLFALRRDRSGASAVTFGLAWFLPAVRRFRKVLAEVLVVSVFIQLLALVAPLFTQVVIDKVLVHRGLTTLQVLVVGLLAVNLADEALNWLGTYVFAHTTSRMDAILGAQLFRHLVALPIGFTAVHLVALPPVRSVTASVATYAITNKSAVWSWGISRINGVSRGSKKSYYLPNLSNILDITTSVFATYALNAERNLHVLGNDEFLCLGYDGRCFAEEPRRQPLISSVDAVSVTISSFAVIKNGEVLAYGDPGVGFNRPRILELGR